MSLFQCENCGCAENTALSHQGIGNIIADWFDWSGIVEREGMMLCSACGPVKFADGDSSGMGEWHEQFDRVMLPKGEFKTNREGNLEHIKTGSTEFRKFAVNQ